MIGRRSLLRAGAAMMLLAGAAPLQPLAAETLEEILLWPGTPPGEGKVTGPEKIGNEGAGFGAVSNVSTPRMRVYRPPTPNGAAVLVAGGGGYFRIQLWKESTPAAQWLQAQGFTALQPKRALYSGADAFERVSARPDFAVLLFPVVSLRKPYDTTRTRREIIGEKPSAAAEAAWSLDTHASKDAPPTIIFASADDPITPPGHGILLFEKLVAAGASAELHMFRDGGHGWGLGKPDQVISQWPALFAHWAQSLEITKKRGE